LRWWEFALLGAGGGALVEVLSLFKWFAVWQVARRTESGVVRDDPPRLTQYVDVPAHAGMLVLRSLLGAVSAAIFAVGGQIQGAYVAVALGFCGPALLGRLGEIPQIASMVSGAPRAPESQEEVQKQRAGTSGFAAERAVVQGSETEAVSEL
jgi:hypothetical protein